MDCIPSLNNIRVAIQNFTVDPKKSILHHLSPLKSGSQTLEWFGINPTTKNIVYIYKVEENPLIILGTECDALIPDIIKLKMLLKVENDFENVMLSLSATKSI